MNELIDKISLLLHKELNVSYLKLSDKSSRHKKHKNRGKGGNYDMIIVSDIFENKSIMQQHRLIKSILKDLFKEEIHALSIKSYTPKEWANRIS